MDQSQEILLGHAIFASSEYRMTQLRRIVRLNRNKMQRLYLHETGAGHFAEDAVQRPYLIYGEDALRD